MRKKDPIFWAASGIFILSLALAGIFQSQFWLALMIGAYLLRPTLASLGLAGRYVDERQMSIQYRSGNIGFVVLLIMCVIFMVKLGVEENHAFELFASAIIVGLAAKGLSNVLLVKNYRESASKIIIAAGLLIALFSVLDAQSVGGFFIQAVPGLVFAGLGVLSRKYPRPIGIVIVVLAISAMICIGEKLTWGQIVTALVIGVPLLIAGICLFIGNKSESEIVSKSTV